MRKKIMRKRPFLNIAVIMAVSTLLSGCEEPDLPIPGIEKEIPEWKVAAENKVGEEAYLRVDKCGDYHFDPEGKLYCDGLEYVGQWVKTDEKTFGEEEPHHYKIRRWKFNDTYGPGGVMDVDLTFRAEGGEALQSGKLYGSIYFADLNGSDGDLNSEIVVRDYFDKPLNTEVNPAVEMSFFGSDNDGRDGSAEEEDGDREYYYDARGTFPRLGEDGDKTYVALDILDEEKTLITRYLWEYTFEVKEPEPQEEEAEEFEPEEPEYYYSVEHSGHWTMTDVRFVGEGTEPVRDGDVTIEAERYGVEGEVMVYTFTGEDGSYHRIRIPDLHPPVFAYSGNNFYAWHDNYSYMEPEGAPGKVICSLALGDVDFDTGKYGVKVTPKYYFKAGYPSKAVEAFDCPPDPEDKDSPSGFREHLHATGINLTGVFPEGEDTGDKIYLAYGVMDGFSGNVRMYNICEYTYTEGPETEWVYNPPMYD